MLILRQMLVMFLLFCGYGIVHMDRGTTHSHADEVRLVPANPVARAGTSETIQPQNPDQTSVESLLKNGPTLPEVFTFDTLATPGYVKEDWPVVLNYKVSQPGRSIFKVYDVTARGNPQLIKSVERTMAATGWNSELLSSSVLVSSATRPQGDLFAQVVVESSKQEAVLAKLDTYALSTYSMQALVRGGWPMVVDFALQRAGTLWIEINCAKVEPFVYRVDDPVGTKQQIIFNLPSTFGEEVKVASITVRAHETAMTGRESRPVPLWLYGIGAGHNAVHSMALERVVFGPRTVRTTPDANASYGFHSRTDFNQVTAQFYRLLHTSRGIEAYLVKQVPRGIVTRDSQVTGAWNCKNTKGHVSLGLHQFHVKAWRALSNGGDWTFACASEAVNIRKP